jgi:hypothetical protein
MSARHKAAQMAPQPTSVYEDSDEIAEALRKCNATGCADPYWLAEAAIQIKGLYRCAVAWERFAAEQPEPVDAERWRRLYLRAINEANGLTNYVEDRPELRRAERNLAAIEAEARSIGTTEGKS